LMLLLYRLAAPRRITSSPPFFWIFAIAFIRIRQLHISVVVLKMVRRCRSTNTSRCWAIRKTTKIWRIRDDE
jgi:hypothetical protein